MLFLLGAMDVLGGILMFFPGSLAFLLGILIILKAVSSLFGIMTGDMSIIILGIIDLASGISLILGLFIPWLWLIVVLKGAYSIVSSLA
ncbi:MAG: hypothetical protein JW700_02765 [Candidatus Aenigmarchaeota archaeon]|nr:hypothetical protein [Candidatus Aenigmarchaeota archaeon]